MSESEESSNIAESPLSQNFYVFVWTLASIASFAIFIIYGEEHFIRIVQMTFEGLRHHVHDRLLLT